MTVTGNLRDVMKESISAAASYVRMRAVAFGIKPPLFEKRDIHVHVPEGVVACEAWVPSCQFANGSYWHIATRTKALNLRQLLGQLRTHKDGRPRPTAT
jgi:Lon protease (S16) C-terminal proteolytic domain